MIIRVLFVLLQTVILYILQTSVFSEIALAGVVPDLLLILVISVAFMRGRIPAMLTGLVAGLVLDCSYNSVIGILALFYMFIGYLAGYAHKVYDENDYTIPLVLIGAGELLYNLMYYIVFLLLEGKLNLGYYLVRFMFPKVIYTVLVSIVFYKLFNMCNVYMMRFDEN